MMQYIYESFALPNFPFTALLIVIACYWIMVIVGFVSAEAFDFDVDIDVDAEPGIEVEGDVGIDGGEGVHGIATHALTFMHLHEAPVMLVVSIFAFAMWAISLTCNHYFNADMSSLRALLYLSPNIFFSVVVTKLVLLPMTPFFRYMRSGDATQTVIVGQTCLIITSEVSTTFGMAEVEQEGPPIQINVRAEKGSEFIKGDHALVVAFDSENNTYTVRQL